MATAKQQPTDSTDTFSPKEIAIKHRVSQHTVLGWIHSGQLIAIDISDPKSRRRKYRVSRASLEAFHAERQVMPKNAAAKSRGANDQAEVKEFV